MIRFLSRNSDGIEVVATLSFPGIWTGDESIVRNICRITSRLWGGKFDPDNPEHYKVIPQIFSGSRLWAVNVHDGVV